MAKLSDYGEVLRVYDRDELIICIDNIDALELKLANTPSDYDSLMKITMLLYGLWCDNYYDVRHYANGDDLLQVRLTATINKFELFASLLVQSSAGDYLRSCAVGELFLQISKVVSLPESEAIARKLSIRALDNAIERNPDYARAQLLLADAATDCCSSDYTYGLDLCALAKALKSSHSLLNADITDGEIDAQQLKIIKNIAHRVPEQAIELLNSLLQKAARNSDYLELRGDCYATIDEHGQAEADYLAAADYVDDRVKSELYCKLGQQQLSNGNAELAENYARQALVFTKDNYPALELLGDIYRSNWKHQRAVVYYSQVKKIQTENSEYYEKQLLGAIYGTLTIDDKIAICREFSQANRPRLHQHKRK